MSGHQHHPAGEPTGLSRSFWRSRAGLAFSVVAVVVGGYLLFEHRLHALSFLPVLILLLCPLLHVFMHGGHGGHEDQGGSGPRSSTSQSEEKS
jgi:hypothetical protein